MGSMKLKLAICAVAISFTSPSRAHAQQAPVSQSGSQSIQDQLNAAMALIQRQQQQLDKQENELRLLQQRFDAAQAAVAAAPRSPTQPGPSVSAAQTTVPPAQGDPAGGQVASLPPLERVGRPPEDEERPVEVAVLESQGSVVTRKGQLTGEFQLDYARAERSRTIFRGIELVESILVGVFDINESRQDLVTASAALRYGLTDRLEFNVRVPFVYRSDQSVIAPISGSTNNDAAATIDSSVKGAALGDIELSARYQLLAGRGGDPFIIANLQGVIPTGRDPFDVPRDSLGRATQATTGAGFYGLTPSVTAILPSDPIVLFGTLGYTFNFAERVNTLIPPVEITYVDPGDAVSASAGVGISFNQRATLNFGYAHSWAFGTTTRSRLIEPTAAWPGERETMSRDLQVGRFLFGVTYRLTDRASLNWSVEVGATEDAPDVRTVLRLPLVLFAGSRR